MQIINKGQNNFLIFTLSEKVTLTNPYYLFSFKHQVLMSSVNFIASDVSGFPTRFNKFLITETTGSVNLTSGVVSLPETGFYEYAIYEQTSSSNLNSLDMYPWFHRRNYLATLLLDCHQKRTKIKEAEIGPY